MQRIAVLVDFDNCRNQRLERAIGQGNPTLTDYQSVFDELVAATVSGLRDPSARSEFLFRFYGGWFESTSGDPTDLHNMIVQCISNHPRQLSKQRLSFEIAYAPLFRGDLRFEATLRTEAWSRPEGRVNATATCLMTGASARCPAVDILHCWVRGKCPEPHCPGRLRDVASRRGQKIVDTLIVADSIIAGLSGDFDQVIIMSADDDLLPGLLFQGERKCALGLARLNYVQVLADTIYCWNLRGLLYMPFNFNQTVEDRICRDLLAFADSRTTVARAGDEFQWTWKRKSRAIQVLSIGDEGFPNRVAFEGQEFDYADFFASDEMGALLWLAQEIERSLAQLKITYPTETIPAKVRLDDDGAQTTFAQALAGVTSATLDSTSLVFLQGRAGDGKSTSLIELTHRQAADYAAGRGRFVYLYIDAQGRSLSRLDEAVALILDDLNASFRYQSLAVLTRLSLVVPVVDGFDELLGSGGYAEAFASLEAFLFRLEGRGTIVTLGAINFLPAVST